MESRRTVRRSHRRRPQSRSSLLVGLVLVLLATVPVLVPFLVTRGGEEPAAAPPGLAAEPGVPALPRAGVGTEPSTSAAPAAPPAPAGALAGTPSPTATSSVPAPPPPPPPAPAPSTAAPTQPSSSALPPAPLAAEPDLVVVAVSWSPEAVAAGQSVVFTAVVRNTGSEPTPAVTHGVGFAVDGQPVSWSSAESTPLAPGEERTYTADGGPAGPVWTATAGDHQLQAYVDDVDRIPEVDNDNNAMTATLTVE